MELVQPQPQQAQALVGLLVRCAALSRARARAPRLPRERRTPSKRRRRLVALAAPFARGSSLRAMLAMLCCARCAVRCCACRAQDVEQRRGERASAAQGPGARGRLAGGPAARQPTGGMLGVFGGGLGRGRGAQKRGGQGAARVGDADAGCWLLLTPLWLCSPCSFAAQAKEQHASVMQLVKDAGLLELDEASALIARRLSSASNASTAGNGSAAAPYGTPYGARTHLPHRRRRPLVVPPPSHPGERSPRRSCHGVRFRQHVRAVVGPFWASWCAASEGAGRTGCVCVPWWRPQRRTACLRSRRRRRRPCASSSTAQTSPRSGAGQSSRRPLLGGRGTGWERACLGETLHQFTKAEVGRRSVVKAPSPGERGTGHLPAVSHAGSKARALAQRRTVACTRRCVVLPSSSAGGGKRANRKCVLRALRAGCRLHELQDPGLLHIFVKVAVVLSLDRRHRERELVSTLLASLHPEVRWSRGLAWGREAGSLPGHRCWPRRTQEGGSGTRGCPCGLRAHSSICLPSLPPTSLARTLVCCR